MVIFKSIAGSIAGAVGGVILYNVLGICLSIFALFSSDLGKWMPSHRQYFWVGCISIGAIVGFLIPIVEESKKQAARKEEERKQRRAREAREKQERDRAAAELERQKELQRQERVRIAAELERKKQQLVALLASTQREFLTIPELVPSADLHLDQAENEFADGAFDPFWDEIEKAANKLAAYNDAVLRISRNAQDYERDSASLRIPVETFSLPEGRLPDARPVAQRLSQIVRHAQKNIDFTTVYNQRAQIHEQRKTNQLLFAGFSTLREAVASLDRTISSSLQQLSRSIHSTLDDILEATRDQTDAMQLIGERQEEAERDRQQAEKAQHEEQLRRDEQRDASDAKYKEQHLAKEDEQLAKVKEVAEILNSTWRKKKPPFRDPYPRDPHP